jgi:hypothetical protein
MKLEHLQEQQLDEGFREKALAAIAAAGLTFGSFAKADTLPDLFAYTDDAGETQVVLDYNDVPKGKMARIVKYEDVFGKMDVDEMNKRAAKARKYQFAHRHQPGEKMRQQMYRTDI